MENSDLIGKKIKLEGPETPNTSIDTDNNLEQIILDNTVSGDLKTDVFDSFSSVAQTREATYELIDTMGMDSTIAAAIESYAEDITQTNSKGEIFWIESDDAEVAKYVNYVLQRFDLDKKAFSWAYNLTKYGDVYVRLLRDSDFENSRLFKKEKEKSTLNEDIYLNINKPGDHYAYSLETVKNPGEMFELTKYGKSMAYIQAGVNVQKDFSNNNEVSYYTKYRMNRKDVNIYSPTEFVHASLESSTSRADEEIDIFYSDEDYKSNVNSETFQVKRGAGILNDLFKVWRQLSLLENSVLLNRLTRSSIVRAIQMEVGNMTPNQVMNVTSRVKNLLENKTALDTGNKMSEFTNPGPMENIVIIPTREGKGALTINQIGGDVDPKQLTDLDWFNNKLFGGLKIPKQYFGFTDDSTGFNGGTSLTILDSRYGKTVKRSQKALIQMVTDILNLHLIDSGKSAYINKFKVMMQAPITQEEIDRKADLSNTLRNISDIMTTLSDIQDPAARLKILKSMLSQTLSDQNVINVLDEEIKKLEAQATEENENQEVESTSEFEGIDSSISTEPNSDLDDLLQTAPEEADMTSDEVVEEPVQEPEPQPENETDTELPTFQDLGVDGTVNSI